MASRKEKLEERLAIAQKQVKDTRHTISPVGGDRVYIQYVSGAKVWETPSVAERAIQRRLATKIPPEST